MMLTLLIALSGWAHAFSDLELQKDLERLKDNPRAYYYSEIPKTGSRHGRETIEASDKDILRNKSVIRNKIKKTILQTLSSPEENDHPHSLLEDSGFVENIYEIDKRDLLSGEIEKKPWSDDYWPIYKGILGARYGAEDFPFSTDWKENFDYFKKFPFFPIFSGGSYDKIKNLSPSEKYDLLIGATKGALTPAMWEEGRAYYEQYGKVETWMGICHGWAPAAYMMDRPTKSIEVIAFDGRTKIKFFPDDIKALASLLWANARTPNKFVGGRCNYKDVDVDENGRPTNSECRDTNPATFHLTTVNRVGLAKRSFVLDTNYDYEVWNQPVESYRISYFNPASLNLADTLENAMINVQDFKKDRYKKYRAANTKFIVGIKMQIAYTVERRPTQNDEDSPDYDNHSAMSLTYDLELDQDGNIVGGEWYRNSHPDFMWTPTKDAKAFAPNDRYLLGEPFWTGDKAMESHWQKHAQESAKRGLPLNKIVQSLVNLSRK